MTKPEAKKPTGTRKERKTSVFDLSDFRVDPASVRKLNGRWCEQTGVVILGSIPPDPGAPVSVGLLDPGDEALLEQLHRLLDRPIRPVKLPEWQIRKALESVFGEKATPAPSYRLELEAVGDLSLEADATVVEVIDEILGRAVDVGASDVHFEVHEEDVDVRLRVDGLLEPLQTAVSPTNIAAVVSRMKVLARLDIAEKRVAQDGRVLAVFEAGERKRKIDFRLSIVPGPFGEDAVLRILDSDRPMVSLPELGFSAAILERFERLVTNPEGMLLVTGPTGSGKTTTLYAALGRIVSGEKKILTVEDPIEYGFSKVSQKQVSSKMSFADYARAFMRQNPDVILIGEIRDEETADAAFRAAQTGHLVLSTLHAPDSVRTLSRLRTLGIDANLLASSLLGALSQRIVRRLCPECRREAAPSEREARAIWLKPDDGPFFVSAGCDSCAGRGYRGRVAIAELFVPDEEVAEMVAAEAPVHRIRARARELGLRSLVEDGLDKARAGTTSLAEVLRVVPQRLIELDRE